MIATVRWTFCHQHGTTQHPPAVEVCVLGETEPVDRGAGENLIILLTRHPLPHLNHQGLQSVMHASIKHFKWCCSNVGKQVKRNIACEQSLQYPKDLVFCSAQAMLCVMTLHAFQSFVRPNVISEGLTNRLSIRQYDGLLGCMALTTLRGNMMEYWGVWHSPHIRQYDGLLGCMALTTLR